MKLYEQINELERKIFRAKQQAAFLKGTLEAVDTAIQLKKQKLDEEIIAYNKRATRDQEILEMHEKNISDWAKKLDKTLTKQLKKIDKEKVEVVVEKSEKEIRKEEIEAKKRLLAEELKRAKEQLEAIKEEKKEELITVGNDLFSVNGNDHKEWEKEAYEKPEELEPGKVQCPECKEWFTKGGAFAAHYKSHFNGM